MLLTLTGGKMKRNIQIVLILALVLSSFTAQASSMVVMWLQVKINKAAPHKKKNKNRKVTLKVLKWAKSGGHSMTYGKKFPGRTFVADLICKNAKEASTIKAGDKVWVKYRTASWMYRNPKTKKMTWGSSRRWYYLGKKLPVELLQ